MSLGVRLMLVAGCLAAGLAAQLALERHLDAAAAGAYPELKRGLDDFPQAVANPALPEPSPDNPWPPATWYGEDRADREALRQKLDFADALCARTYHPEHVGVAVTLYMVYSRAGEDRNHHPEICIREVAGAPEELDGRALVYLDAAQERPVQRFRFRTSPTRSMTVYYWHYTLDPVFPAGQTSLQVLHQKLSHPAPSVTVEVSTYAQPVEQTAVERDFLVAVDALLQRDHLPATARIGCDRLPVGVIRE
jgi:hypothetical protein